MRIFPKVTLDREEFWNNEKPECVTLFYNSSEEFWSTVNRSGTNGLCGNRTIWLKMLNPVTLLHELLHYPIRYFHRTSGDASIVLFCDFLTDCLDFVNGILRYKEWRKEIHEALEVVTVSWNDWLDWILCR